MQWPVAICLAMTHGVGLSAVLLLMACILCVPAHAVDPKPGGRLAAAQEMAEGWKTGRVYVEPALRTVYDDATVASLTELAEKPTPKVWVALVAAGADRSKLESVQTLAAELHGEQGTYVVQDVDSGWTNIVTNASGFEKALITGQARRYGADREDTTTSLEWLREVLTRLEDPQVPDEEPSVTEKFRHNLLFEPVKFGLWTAAALTVLILGVYGIAKRRGARPGRYRIPTSVVKAARQASRDNLRTMLGEDSLRIAARLEKLQAGDLSQNQSEQVQHGLDAFSLARRISEDDSAREDDLAGAMVLFDIAEHDLNAVQSAVGAEGSGSRPQRGQRGKSARTSQGGTGHGLCVINPRHGRAATTRKLPRMEKFAEVSVPMCRQCVSAAAEGRRMQWLQVDGKPYPARDSVWGNTLYGATDSDLVADVIRARAMGTD